MLTIIYHLATSSRIILAKHSWVYSHTQNQFNDWKFNLLYYLCLYICYFSLSFCIQKSCNLMKIIWSQVDRMSMGILSFIINGIYYSFPFWSLNHCAWCRTWEVSYLYVLSPSRIFFFCVSPLFFIVPNQDDVWSWHPGQIPV